MLETVTAGDPTATDGVVIWLHGLGADGYDFQPIVPELRLPPTLRLRFVFPHAPVRPVTLNGGLPMRAWYDIAELTREGRHDPDGMQASVRAIEALIGAEVARGVDHGRIVLVGFSQGGAVALTAGLGHAAPLAGIIGLSTYLPNAGAVVSGRHPANRKTPVLLAHGQSDPVLPVSLGREVRDLLQAAGQPVEWNEYAMQHQVCLEEITRIGDWLRQRFQA